ncbi:hypothetical protein O6H91_11G076600 [Diphasiastrum complanatum]|uniref:Uncharacterized protein n=1 Tax=Diphasiastrum complanatum TaxID=34168 RepID=A0ACC2CAN0_DIPCM|nr:hypothetical protein O6H91_11G076600 [Diphasiastrum complanatum]
MYTCTLSTIIISSNHIHPLLHALTNEHEDHIKSASAWSLGQIGRHSPVHALAIAEVGLLLKLVFNFLSSSSSEDLQTKCKKALKVVIEHLIHLLALDFLLQIVFQEQGAGGSRGGCNCHQAPRGEESGHVVVFLPFRAENRGDASSAHGTSVTPPNGPLERFDSHFYSHLFA